LRLYNENWNKYTRMKIIVSIILIALVAFVCGLYLPWWTIAVAAFLVALIIPQFPWKAFMSGFAAIFVLWATLAWWKDLKNDGILATKMAEVFSLPANSLMMVLMTALVGGLIGGFAALSGAYLRASPK
jgi:hypothetical protein